MANEYPSESLEAGASPVRVLVTGASGFVGRSLCPVLNQQGREVTALLRSPPTGPQFSNGIRVAGPVELDERVILAPELFACDVIVHLAAKVHVMAATEADRQAHDRINHQATLNLARQAAAAGVRRFIYLSSVKVNGERTCGEVFSADSQPNPQDSYGRSKCAAEQALFQLAEESGLEVVIIRPPLVYGPGVKANFAQLFRWIRRGIPLPFAAINNRRSLVSVNNLCDLINCCIDHPGACNQLFMASDGEAISTAELTRRISVALGRSNRQIYVPLSLLRWLGQLGGKSAMVGRLTDDLEVDIEKNQQLLNWTPPFQMADTLKAMVKPDE